MSMHVIDYQIVGDDLQFVEIELDPGEAAIGEAGVMMYMQDGIAMDTVFGDGFHFLGYLKNMGLTDILREVFPV